MLIAIPGSSVTAGRGFLVVSELVFLLRHLVYMHLNSSEKLKKSIWIWLAFSYFLMTSLTFFFSLSAVTKSESTCFNGVLPKRWELFEFSLQKYLEKKSHYYCS